MIAARLAIALLIAAPAWLLASRASAVEDDGQLWIGLSARQGLSDRLAVSLEVQNRFADDVSELERVLVRPSLSWSFTPWLTGALGYDAHIVESPSDFLEQRVWQQLAAGHEIGAGVSGSLRFRLEERIIEDVDGAAVRARIRLRVQSPLPFASDAWYAALSNEVFVGFNSLGDGPKRGFDEDRVFVGLGRSLPWGLKLEAGYQLQYLDRDADDRANHMLLLLLGFSRDR